MFLGLWLEPFPEIVDFAMPFEKKLKYISLGPVGRHFITFSLALFSSGISTNIYFKFSRIPVRIICRDLINFRFKQQQCIRYICASITWIYKIAIILGINKYTIYKYLEEKGFQ